MANVAFCGLGQMGQPMAKRLVEAGHRVHAWNRSPGKADALLERGATLAPTPADAAADADVAITMLADAVAVEAVALGEDGVVRGLASGGVLIEMSTIGPSAVQSIAQRLPGGVGMMDAPVLGSVRQAEDGILRVLVGGDVEVCEPWMPLLQGLGIPRRIGPLGSGAAMKVVFNATLVAAMSMLGEALALADAFGLDEAIALDVLSDSPLGATVRRKRSNMESGRYPANFKLSLARKDGRLVEQEAAAHGIDLRLAPAVARWFQAAEDAGLGGLDYSSVIAHVRGAPAT